MGKLHNGKPLLPYISMYLIVMIVLAELYQISATSQIDQSDTNRHARRKRQAADFILMGYKAQRAIKGTTKPSEFFRRIGKKWAPGLRASDLILRPNGLDGGSYLEPDEKVEDW
ncbi:hypothetical protein ACF0H5_015231 [Mactra antiquata]